ncbi:MAG TPA: tetratricopeptide repeat protein, partial [Bryobacteraceae bacterium]|nr:tetratricopeptide repeat protein [Bryobacteraceae bacterium]
GDAKIRSQNGSCVAQELPPEVIADALAAVLRSPNFRGSKRRKSLLKYLVDNTLAGKGQQLKEFNIGVDVYGRDPASYDPRIDPVVRVEISRLRSKLKEHYETDGRDEPVRIELPKRSYEVFFHAAGNGSAEAPVRSRRISGKWIAVAAAILLLAAVTAFAFHWGTQSSIASASSKSRPVDPEVADLMLKARARRAEGTREAFDQAVIYLNDAIRRDPKYADAYADLAGCYAAAAVNFASKPLDYAAKAKAAAATALQLDPASARAYSALGLVDSSVFLNWKLGESELRQAIRLSPRNPVAHSHLRAVLAAEGRFAEAVAEAKAAADLDPLTAANIGIGLTYYVARDYDKALAEFIKARDLHPEVVVAHFFLGLGWEGKGEFEKALEEYRRCLPQMPEAKVSIAHVLAAMGQVSEARAMLGAIEHPESGEPPNAFDVACVYAALGDRYQAFRWLEQSYRDRSIRDLKIYPMLDPIRSDPRYAELLARTGLNFGG